MNDKLCGKEAMKAFISAIDKGVVKRLVGCNGIKFLDKGKGKGLVEVKINGDDRVWGNKIYVNDDVNGKKYLTN